MPVNHIKSNLLVLAKTGKEQQQAFIDSLTPSQQIEVGTPDQWSAKDTICHLTHWQAYRIAEYQRLVRGEVPERLTGIDDHNQLIFEDYRDRPWPQVIAAANGSFGALLTQLENSTDEELTTLNGLPPPMNGQAWRLFWIYGFSHVLNHIADYYYRQGDIEQAVTLQRKRASDTATLGIDQVRGATEYDLACLYAKIGRKEQALTELHSALGLAPNLREWSKEDPDLVSLHNEPVYKALY